MDYVFSYLQLQQHQTPWVSPEITNLRWASVPIYRNLDVVGVVGLLVGCGESLPEVGWSNRYYVWLIRRKIFAWKKTWDCWFIETALIREWQISNSIGRYEWNPIGGGLRHFLLYLYLGKWCNDKHIFQMGWFNHQLEPEVLPKLMRFFAGMNGWQAPEDSSNVGRGEVSRTFGWVKYGEILFSGDDESSF